MQIFRVTQRKTPTRVSEIEVALGPKRKFLALAMYISCLFVSISFSFGSQREPSFQWNMGLSGHPAWFLLFIFLFSCWLPEKQQAQDELDDDSACTKCGKPDHPEWVCTIFLFLFYFFLHAMITGFWIIFRSLFGAA